MPRQTRHSTEYKGVYYVELANRDQSFFIRYKLNGKSIEEKAGRSNQGWNAEKAEQLRKEKMSETKASTVDLSSNVKVQGLRQWTFLEIFAEYLRRNSKLKGRANDVYRFKNYLENQFGLVIPADVTQDDIERFKHDLQNKELKPATIGHALELLRRLSNFAVKKKLCSGLNFRIQMPKVENRKTENLTQEQLQKLLEVLNLEPDIQVSNLVRLALYTGMRRGELFNLNWNDIDFYNKTITVKSGNKGEHPKIPLNEMAEKVLAAHAQTETASKFVFPGRGGKKRTECKRPLLRIRKKAGLPHDFRILQGLRHVYATMLVRSGKVDLETLQTLLLHKSPLMTQRYAHLLDKDEQSLEAEVIEKDTETINEVTEEVKAVTEDDKIVSEEVKAVTEEEKIVNEEIAEDLEITAVEGLQADYADEIEDEREQIEVKTAVATEKQQSTSRTDNRASKKNKKTVCNSDNAFADFFKGHDLIDSKLDNVTTSGSQPVELQQETVVAAPVQEVFTEESKQPQTTVAAPVQKVFTEESKQPQTTVVTPVQQVFTEESKQPETEATITETIVDDSGQQHQLSPISQQEEHHSSKEVQLSQGILETHPKAVTGLIEKSTVIKTNFKVENNANLQKDRPSLKDLKNDLRLLSKMIQSAPRRGKSLEQKQSQL